MVKSVIMSKVIFVGMMSVLLFLSGTSVALGGEYSGTIDPYLEGQMKRAGIQNLSLGIVKDGEIVYLQSYGEDSRGESGAKEDLYPIGSISKTVTGLAVRQLISTGVIDENASVDHYLPDFRAEYAGNAVNITVGQLIRHTSGIPALAGGAPYIYNAEYSLEKIMDKSLHMNLVNHPGVAYKYSNMNYLILGRLIEIVSGQRYGEYVREWILTPLEMENTFPDVTELQGKESMHAYLPFYGASLPVSYPFPGGIAPAGGFFSTAEDLCRLMICYQKGGYVNGLSLIANNQVSAPESAASVLCYDIYWTIMKKVGPLTLSHNGSLPGYSSSMLMDLSSGYSVVVLANSFDQFGLSISVPTPWSMAEGILTYLKTGSFSEQTAVKWNYSLLVWGVILILGMSAFAVVMVVREIQSTKKHQKISKMFVWAAVYFVLPALWLIVVPPFYDSSWGWLLAATPDLNLSILFIMAVLVLTGIGTGISMLIKRIKP